MRKPVKPRKPPKPKPPEKTFSKKNVITTLSWETDTSLADLFEGTMEASPEMFPEDLSWKDIHISVDEDYDYNYYSCSCCNSSKTYDITFYHNVPVPNTSYEKQYKKYEKNLKAYDKKMAKYKEDMKSYKAKISEYNVFQENDKKEKLLEEKERIERDLRRLGVPNV